MVLKKEMEKKLEKNKTPNMKMNFFYNILYRISSIIIPLITTPYVSRVLGAENSGIYSYTYTIAWYFVILGCFGFENYGNRQIAMVKDDEAELNKTFSSLLGLQAITGSIAIISYVVYLVFFCSEYKMLFSISILYVISSLFNISWLFYGLEQFKTTALRTIVARFTGLLLIFVFVRTAGDLWKYVAILAAMELLNQLILWARIKSVVSIVRVSITDVMSHLRGCAILFVPVILINIYRLMDKHMLGQISTMDEVGFYTYADKITEMPFHVITAIGTVMLPRMTNMIAKGQIEKSKQYIETTMRYNTVFACAIAFGMMAVSSDLSVLFLGDKYSRCAILINIIAPMLIVRAWANVARTQFLMPNHRDKEYVISLVVGVIANLVLNSLTIPYIGAEGAALATLVAESLVAITQIIFTNRDLPIKKYILPNIPFIFFGLLMWMFVRAISTNLHDSWLGLAIQIFAGAVLYLALSIVYLYKIDRPTIKRVLKLKK